MLLRPVAARKRHAIDLGVRHLYEPRLAIDDRVARKIDDAVAGVFGLSRKFDGNLRREMLEVVPGADLRRVHDHALAVFRDALARILPALRRIRGFDAFELAVSAGAAGPRSQAVREMRSSASQIPFKRIVIFLGRRGGESGVSLAACRRRHSFVFVSARKLRALRRRRCRGRKKISRPRPCARRTILRARCPSWRRCDFRARGPSPPLLRSRLENQKCRSMCA